MSHKIRTHCLREVRGKGPPEEEKRDQPLRSQDERGGREDSTCGSSCMHPAPLGIGSWAARLLTPGTLSRWLREVQYGWGFQSSHTCETVNSGQFHVCLFLALFWFN